MLAEPCMRKSDDHTSNLGMGLNSDQSKTPLETTTNFKGRAWKAYSRE